MSIKEKRPPGPTGEALEEIGSQHSFNADHPENQALPSRATLARRFPKLRVNRFSGRWCDDATGARGDDFASLLAFINGGQR